MNGSSIYCFFLYVAIGVLLNLYGYIIGEEQFPIPKTPLLRHIVICFFLVHISTVWMFQIMHMHIGAFIILSVLGPYYDRWCTKNRYDAGWYKK